MQTGKKTLLWFIAGIVFSLMLLLIVFRGLTGKVTITDPQIIPDAADAVMNCIQAGDWTALEEQVAGNAKLDPFIGAENSAERIIFYAYQQSLHWDCREEFEIQGPCVAQRVTVRCLDIQRVTEKIAEICSTADPHPSSSMAQPNNLRMAAEQVLTIYTPMAEHDITLVFLLENGQWQLLPNSALQSLLSGFTVVRKGK